MSVHATNVVTPSLVIFGPQITTWPSADFLAKIRDILIEESRLNVFREAIRGLHELAKKLIDFDPRFATVAGIQAANVLGNWIDNGEFSLASEIPPNAVLTPLTVIIQVVLYSRYACEQETAASGANEDQLSEVYFRPFDVQGFCTGFLTAAALACSKNGESLNTFASVSLRLAFCIGVAIDLDTLDASDETTCLAVRWRAETGKAGLEEVLRAHPNVYISVISEPNQVAITIPKRSIIEVTHQLSLHGYIVKDFGLSGRFHSSALESTLQNLFRFCDAEVDLQLPRAEKLLIQLRSNIDGKKVGSGRLDKIALRSILTDMADWNSNITPALTEFVAAGNSNVVVAGMTNCIPKLVSRALGLRVSILSDSIDTSYSVTDSGFSSAFSQSSTAETPKEQVLPCYSDNAIAVIGMACKFPGADSVSEFWDLIRTGRSMTQEVPESRFPTRGLRRTTGKQFWGNFVNNADSFDHKFFRKSAREAAQMDPQQRLLLETAYQTVESSGYFGKVVKVADDMGCYIGVCASDYNDNVASHPPTAFSSLGTLRAFLSGKISHYFGWSGPSVTYDTACSSSAVAIDAACKAINSGDCSQAIAGGANIFTSANFYQNLMAASFLSPTGPTKSFDASADGYCRGEGVGLVMLKKLSTAMEDGDKILGVIAATAVNQNSNVVPITVPYSASQIKLYEKVSRLAGIDPMEVSYIEAHGTGTRVGDPIECESIRQVFANPHRENTLYLGSVKANIGHTEATSGVAGLIKTILMMQHRTIPKQANFALLNPNIRPLEEDHLDISLVSRVWDAKFLAACVNNYGAAGSNAAIIVCQAPTAEVPVVQNSDLELSSWISPWYLICIAAHSVASLTAYTQKFLKQVSEMESNTEKENILGSLAFNLNRQRNPNHPYSFTTTVSSFSELREQLSKVLSSANFPQMPTKEKRKPVVLAFGGQVSNIIGLPKEIYQCSARLRFHLEQCEAVIRRSGFPSLFPDIFSKEPIEDVVRLHTKLFAVQYSFAKTWLDCGLHVDTIVGHSFGQLTALSVCGSLSLEHGLKLVASRATLMQSHWGVERGSMIAIEADGDIVSEVLAAVNAELSGQEVEIACYNGPASHVLVGSETSIDAVEEFLAAEDSLNVLKRKRLNVPYGFHSRFTEAITPGLLETARTLEYNVPQIRLETCSDKYSWGEITAELVTDHTRSPVYFHQAVQRIADGLGPCTWLEAGMNSSILGMVRRALDNTSGHEFHHVSFSSADPVSSLSQITVNLWEGGENVCFWPFHDSQSCDYDFVELPPYQFENSRHWLEWIDHVSQAHMPAPLIPEVIAAPATFMSVIESSSGGAEFLFDPRFDEYRIFVQGHRVLANPLCPAPLYLELVARGLQNISEVSDTSNLLCIQNLEIKAPLGIAGDRFLNLKLEEEKSTATWKFEFSSRPRVPENGALTNLTQHASGSVTLRSVKGDISDEVLRYERLIGYNRTQDLARDLGAESMQGSLIYKAFAKVVHYDPFYKGIRSVAAKQHEVVGQVKLPKSSSEILKNTAYHPLMVDNFIQVAGLHVNILNECEDDEVYVCTKLSRIQPTAAFKDMNPEAHSWTVYSSFSRLNGKEVVNDIFVFNNETKALVVYMLGVRFTKVAMRSLARVLASANTPHTTTVSTKPSPLTTSVPVETGAKQPVPLESPQVLAPPKMQQEPQQPASPDDLTIAVKTLLSKAVDIDIEEIRTNTTPEELGIDSLMVTEVISDIQQMFEVEIPIAHFIELQDVNSLVEYIRPNTKGYHVDCLSSNSRPSSSGTTACDSLSDGTVDKVSLNASSKTGAIVTREDDYLRLVNLLKYHLELEAEMTDDMNLADAGLDSLLCMELVSDIERDFGCHIDPTDFTSDTTLGDLVEIVFPGGSAVSNLQDQAVPDSKTIHDIPAQSSLANVQSAFQSISRDYDKYATESGFADFWSHVYPSQARLVLAYVVEAFASLGIKLASITARTKIPQIQALPKHDLLVEQLYKILEDASLIQIRADGKFRTSKPVDQTPSDVIFEQIVHDFPQHGSEHKLLRITGSKLADCLIGNDDALMLLFKSSTSRKLLEDVYTNGPMYSAVTKQLGSYFERAFATAARGEIFEVLELGGGTGGTTKYLVEHLMRLNVPFRYTFTDLSNALVGAMKRKFAGHEFMSFAVVDIEKKPEEKHINKYHAIVSTNCIHATSNLKKSCSNIRAMLRQGGFIALVEFTRNMFWFDLVFGLLDGWWFYNDGRSHVLADEFFWERSLRAAGFKHVAWTGADSEESNTLRILTAFQHPAQRAKAIKSPHTMEEQVLFKQVGPTSLYADIYYPDTVMDIMDTAAKRPIAIMIHGGGHIMLSRKDNRPKQRAELLRRGFLPVSIDYRLCPEVDIQSGAMTDVRDAIQWARYQLPSLSLRRSDVQIDGERIVLTGWSTGGTLAMTSAWTTVKVGLPPPNAVFVWYCPTDYEDPFWTKPNYPGDSSKHAQLPYNLLEGVRDHAITGHNVPPFKAAIGGWNTTEDARSRMILHNNWHGQTLPVIINGLPTKIIATADPAFSNSPPILPQPPLNQIQRISPVAQIRAGAYKVPTFLLHTDADDLIPVEQAHRAFEALRENGVRECKLMVVKGAPHLFDIYRKWSEGEGRGAMREGFEWLVERVGL